MPYTWPPTLAEAKAETKISSTANDAVLQTVLDAAVSILENHPDYRVKDAVTATTYTEWRDGGNGEIVLAHYPVVTVTSITEYTPTAQTLAAEPLDTTATFTGYGYTVDALSGIIYRTSGGRPYPFCGRVQIVYQAGSVTVPADARLAALLLVEHIWMTHRGSQGAALPAGLDPDVDTSGLGPSFILPNRVRETLEAYRRTPAVA